MKIKPHPASLHFSVIATDIVVFTMWEEQLHVLLLPVDNEAFVGMEGVPGGLILPDETADDSANRHLTDKGNIKVPYLEQLYTFSAIKRDPRGRVVSVAYLALVPSSETLPSVAADARWVPVNDASKLAYDHDEVLLTAVSRLRGKMTYTTIARYLVSPKFTLTELQLVFEAILVKKFDKRNFRKKILALDIVRDTGSVQEGVQNRPASLYEFKGKGLTELPLIV